MPDAHTNFAYSLVTNNPGSAGVTINVQPGDGAHFPPAPPAFNAVVCPAGSIPLPETAEIVRVSARTADALTVLRTQEGSNPRTIVAGDAIFAAATGKTFTDIEQGSLALSGTALGKKLSWGMVNGTTGTISNGSGDFSLTRNGVGNYTFASTGGVSWPSNMVPIVSCTDSGGAYTIAHVHGISAGSFGVITYNSATGAALDTYVMFVVIY